jgi:RimJ/RimL family protein N-acetyltransferase
MENSRPHFFESPRLIARRFGTDDLADFVAMRSDPEVARFQSWENFTQEEGREFLEWLAGSNPGAPGWFQFALERKEDGAFVGDCGLRTVETDNRLAQIGYTIARPYWRRGYAREAVRALTAYAFATFPLHRITASVDPLNLASVRVLERTGFVKEAHFRQAEWFKGDWADDAIYAMLASEAVQVTGEASD